MFLKSLTLKGFKSFAEPTTLELEPGVTVVVGPNGSGKSNVVDAVAWVLGAQGPRTVRSSKMDDVIFAGSSQRPALGRAEVSLVIDNSSGRIPAPMSEITISRTLFRSGDSEYAINRVPCRLLDVQELLSDTGVGRQQHVIVGQGQLDAVLNARPEDRRLIVEEAAGVLKYRRRRERAERRLEATEGNLLRLQDLLREVRRQIRPLERQAEVARRHDEIASETHAVRMHLAGREIAELAARRDAGEAKREQIAAEEGLLRSRLARLDADVAAAEASFESSRSAQDSTAVARLEGLRERARGLSAVLTERGRSLRAARQMSLGLDVAASLEADRSDLLTRLAEVDVEIGEASSSLAELDGGDEAAGSGGPGNGGGADRGATFETGTAPEELASARERMSVLTHGLQRDREELARIDERLEALERRAGGLAEEASRRRTELGDGERDSQTLGLALREAELGAAAAEEARERAEEQLRVAERETHSWSARAEALSQALEEARGLAGMEYLEDLDGLVGSLAELVRVDAGWEEAFGAAAGDVLSAVVTGGPDSAREAVRVLKAAGARGPVLALASLLGPRAAGGVPPRLPDGAESLREHVSGATEGISGLLDVLLSGVTVAGDWEHALDLHLSRPDLVVVTRSGDRFSARGWCPGGGAPEASLGALEEARRRAEEHSAIAAAAAEATSAGRASAAEARRSLSEAAGAVAENESRVRSARELLGRSERERAEVEEDAGEAIGRRSMLLEAMARDEAVVSELRESLCTLEERAIASAERAEASARLADEAASRRTALQVGLAGLTERQSVLSQRLAKVEHKLASSDPGEEAHRIAQVDRDSVAVERLARVVTQCARALDVALERESWHRRRQMDETRSLAESLEAMRRERSEAERELAVLRESSQRAEIDQAEVRLRTEAAFEMVRRELDCEPDAALAAPAPELPAGTSARQRVRELDRELRMIGPVNPLAQEELASLTERLELLEGQLEDVRSARRELAKVIRAVDAEIVDVFAAAYAEVADNFVLLFSTLFPGGQGQLRLSDPADLLGTGIEVEARPAGRGVRKLSLLSGGERSLVALAFLFAIFRSRPSPFYMLDEVEAALDDVNLVKFLDLLHEFRDDAQLIVVSHQKRTMETADCLYGVTMQPGGASKIVSERAREAEPA